MDPTTSATPWLTAPVGSLEERDGVRAAWDLFDRVAAASFSTPAGRAHVAWRRLAAEGDGDAAALRRSWIAAGGAGSPVLPLIEPWEYATPARRAIRGAVGERSVTLDIAVDGDGALGRGVVVADDGSAYEVGAPSEAQVAAWSEADDGVEASPAVAAAAAAVVPLPDWRSAAGYAIGPIALATAAVALGVLTHHLQIEVFVI